jgi:hypothetical protein
VAERHDDRTREPRRLERRAGLWTNASGPSIGRATLDGRNVQQAFIKAESDPSGIAVSHGVIYWTDLDRGTVSRADLDGSNVRLDIVKGIYGSCGVTADTKHLYWSDLGPLGAENGTAIGRANRDGTSPQQKFIDGLNAPRGIAIVG